MCKLCTEDVLIEHFYKSPYGVVKIHHYVWIVRWNHRAYGWEGNRAHTLLPVEKFLQNVTSCIRSQFSI